MPNRANYRSVFFNLCLSVALLGLALPTRAVANDSAKEQERVQESGNVIKDLANASNGIPTGLLNKSECVIVPLLHVYRGGGWRCQRNRRGGKTKVTTGVGGFV